MSEHDVVIETQGAARILAISRPHARNALSLSVRRALSDGIVAADLDPSIRAIIVTGSKDLFAAGGDIKEFVGADAAQTLAAELQRIWQPIAQCTKPIIAAVEGYALGGGAELALHADIIVASETAQFAFPEVALGILPGAGGTQRFPRAVGKYRAMRYLLTGDRFTAREALDMGLISELAPAGEALSRGLQIAERIASLPPLAVRQIKDVVLAGADASLASALILERNGHNVLRSSEDHREGVSAFLDKRKPVFLGR